MSDPTRGRAAVAALAAIIAITASWWALALWPVGSSGAEWLLRTREVCFGSTADALPTPAGWLLLVGQPLGMFGLLATVWATDLRAGLARMTAQVSGQLTLGVVSALVLTGLWATAVRVRTAELESFSTGAAELAEQLTRINDAAPALSLTDQSGRQVTLADFRGRPVLLSFAFAHCATVCPLIVSDVLTARRRLGEEAPAVLFITLDPWRDTPSRLPAIAQQWSLPENAYVLSGAPDDVERTLNAWRVPRVRNEKTGEIAHPTIVYVVNGEGRIAYVINGNVDVISAAVRSL